VIITRYLFKETFKTQLSVLLVLFLIFFCDRLIRTLADVTEGSIPSDYVLLLVALNMPRMAELMLPLSLYISILFTFSRLYAESEITVMYATGMGSSVLTRAGLRLTIFTMLLAIVNTFWLSPWSNYKSEAVIDQIAAENGLNLLSKGQFQSTPDGRAVIFINDIKNSGQDLSGIFVGQLKDISTLKPSVLYAKTGQAIEQKDGGQVLVLSKGTRYEGIPNRLDYQNTTFNNYRALIGQKKVELKDRDWDEKSIQVLWQSRNNKNAFVELQWRIALVICIPLLIMVVIPLSKVNPRQGRFANVVPALLFYLAYFISITAMKSAMEDGRISADFGLWGLQFMVVLVILAMKLKNTLFVKQLFARGGVKHV